MESQKRDLQAQIDYKKTDDFVEERARNDLSMIKPGEQVYVVNDDTVSGMASRDSGVLAEVKALKTQPNWYLWIKLFF